MKLASESKSAPAYANVLLFLGTFLLGIIFLEFIVRIFSIAPEPPKASVHHLSSNPKLLYEPAPGKSLEIERPQEQGGGDSWLVKINKDGFRDQDFELMKPANTFRIEFVGDSVVFGYGLNNEDSLPKQLETKLNEAGPTRHVEVLNLGVSGYDSEQQIEFFKTSDK